MAFKTLKMLGITTPMFDAPSGRAIISSDGILDEPDKYNVMEHEDEGQREFIMAQGPSGDVDMIIRDVTGTRVYRDIAAGSIAEFKDSYF